MIVRRCDICAGKVYDSLVFSSSQRGKTEKTKWSHQNTLQAVYSCKKRGKTKDLEIAVSRREGALQARAWFKLTKRDAELLNHLLKQFIDGNHPFDSLEQ